MGCVNPKPLEVPSWEKEIPYDKEEARIAQKLLEATPFFLHMKKKAIAEFAKIFRVQDFPPNHVFFKQNTPAECFFIIGEGTVNFTVDPMLNTEPPPLTHADRGPRNKSQNSWSAELGAEGLTEAVLAEKTILRYTKNPGDFFGVAALGLTLDAINEEDGYDSASQSRVSTQRVAGRSRMSGGLALRASDEMGVISFGGSLPPPAERTGGGSSSLGSQHHHSTNHPAITAMQHHHNRQGSAGAGGALSVLQHHHRQGSSTNAKGLINNNNNNNNTTTTSTNSRNHNNNNNNNNSNHHHHVRENSSGHGGTNNPSFIFNSNPNTLSSISAQKPHRDSSNNSSHNNTTNSSPTNNNNNVNNGNGSPGHLKHNLSAKNIHVTTAGLNPSTHSQPDSSAGGGGGGGGGDSTGHHSAGGAGGGSPLNAPRRYSPMNAGGSPILGRLRQEGGSGTVKSTSPKSEAKKLKKSGRARTRTAPPAMSVTQANIATAITPGGSTCLWVNRTRFLLYLQKHAKQRKAIANAVGSRMETILQRVSFLRGIAFHKMKLLVSMLQFVPLECGEVLFRDGDFGEEDGNAFYILYEGRIAVVAYDEDGNEEVLAELKPGQWVGEIGVMIDMPRTATVVADTRCLLLKLRKADFLNFLKLAPEALANFRAKLTHYRFSLRHMIHNSVFLHYFLLYLKDKQADHLGTFWISCRDYCMKVANEEPADELLHVARELFEKYMLPNSSSFVQLPREELQETLNAIDRARVDHNFHSIFERPQYLVLQQLDSTHFPGFQKSEFFQECLKNQELNSINRRNSIRNKLAVEKVLMDKKEQFGRRGTSPVKPKPQHVHQPHHPSGGMSGDDDDEGDSDRDGDGTSNSNSPSAASYHLQGKQGSSATASPVKAQTKEGKSLTAVDEDEDSDQIGDPRDMEHKKHARKGTAMTTDLQYGSHTRRTQ